MASLSGVAGFDGASIVDQLMQVEAYSQNRLKIQRTSQESVVTALQKLNTQVAALATAAKSLADPATWQTLKATSSNPLVTVTAGASATATNLNVTVDRVAAAHQLGFTNSAALTDIVTSGSTSVRVDKLDGTTVDLNTGDGTLQGLITAINGSTANTGLTATAVRTGEGAYRLLVSSAATGAASDFTLTNTDGTALLGGASVRAGSDAQISLGLGITATSTTNTFTDIVPGVTVTVAPNAVGALTAPVGTTPTTTNLAIQQDPTEITTKVKSLVDQLNTVLSALDAQTLAGTDGKAGGILVGDSTIRGVRASLLESVFGTGDTTMADLGVQTDRYGKIVFDQPTFEKAYAADATATASRFTSGVGNGWASRLQTAAEGATHTRDGSITAAITGRNSRIERLTDSIESWDMRLEMRRTTLSRQFTALETALASMSNQSSWLSSQIASLPSYNS